jgi:hypothetical protein
VVAQAVEQGGGGLLISENVDLLPKGEVGGHDGRAALAAAREAL